MSPKMESTALINQIDSCIKDIQEVGGSVSVCQSHWPLANGVKILLECEKAHIEERSDVATAAAAVVLDAATVRETAAEAARVAAKEVIREAGLVRAEASSSVSWGKLKMTGNAASVAAVVVAVGAIIVGVVWFQSSETRATLRRAAAQGAGVSVDAK